jgi:hypothetical protein
MLLAARMKCYGRGGMRCVVFPASFSKKSELKSDYYMRTLFLLRSYI